MSEQTLLELRNVTKEYTSGILIKKITRAVNNVSFSMPAKPWITALIGESGSGKTTIARMILGFIKPTSGEILYKGQNIIQWLRRKNEYYREVQPIFQDPYSIYNPVYKIDRVLKITVKKFKLARSNEEANALIIKALEEIGLRPEDVLGRYPHQLSGGERQRVMLARILLLKPKLIVADEPVSMIDVSLRALFLGKLQEFKIKYGISCLYISHDLHSASYLADHVIVLYKGNIVEESPVEKILQEPLHPYTQLLLDSVPIPDPIRRWSKRLDLSTIESTKKIEKGCPFVNRCTRAIDKCLLQIPPLKNVDKDRKVACFLYF